MSEFYEIMTPLLFYKSKMHNVSFECMICYETCDLITPIAILPCFHILHEECVKQTIEMSFRSFIQSQSNKTVCHEWQFLCPQKDSKDSLSEQGRTIKSILGRNIKPSIPRCLDITITNPDMNYFSIPYVREWYETHTLKKLKSVFADNHSSTIIIMITQFALLLPFFHISPFLFLGISCSLTYQLFYSISIMHSDTIAKFYITTLTIIVRFILLCIGLYLLYCTYRLVVNNMSTIRTILYVSGFILRCVLELSKLWR
jgi:hypothetical protein